MGQIKNFSYMHFMLACIVFMIVVTSIISFVIIYFLKIPLPQGTEEYYFAADAMDFTDGVVIVSVLDLQKNIMQSSDLQTLFISNFKQYMLLIIIINIIAFSFLAIVLYCFYQKFIISSIEKTARCVSNIKDMDSCDFQIEKEFHKIICEMKRTSYNINCLYRDLNNLSTYVSHEQKNALALLRAKIQNGNTDSIIDNIDDIVKKFDDILTMCAHKSNRTEEITDLSLICGMAVDEYRKKYPRIQFDFNEDEPLYVCGSELWISRAVSNLLDNAIKYGEDTEVYVYTGISHNCPYISVTDYGIGIDVEKQEKIFQSGYRIGNIKKDGYGIGLSLVKHVAELCNAFVWIKSEKENGTTFKIVFPPSL